MSGHHIMAHAVYSGNCSGSGTVCTMLYFSFLTHNSVTSSDISHEKRPVIVWQKDHRSATTSADAERCRQLLSKRPRVEEQEQCDPDGRCTVM